MKIISFNIIIEFSCFLFSILLLRKDRGFWKMIPFFLCFVVLTEFTARQLRLSGLSNQWLYNIYLIAEAGMVGFGFQVVSQQLKPKKDLFIYGTVLFILSYLTDTFLHGFLVFHSNTNALISIIFVVYCFYYYHLLNESKGFYTLKTLPEFWWVTGCLFYYFGSTSSNVLFELLSKESAAMIKIPLRYYILNVLIFILYSCWSYAFLCRYNQRKSSSF